MRFSADVAFRFIALVHRFKRNSAFQKRSAVRHNDGTEALALVSQSATSKPKPQLQETTMKTFIIAALLSISSIATIGAPAHADTFAVHGYTTNYGGR